MRQPCPLLMYALSARYLFSAPSFDIFLADEMRRKEDCVRFRELFERTK